MTDIIPASQLVNQKNNTYVLFVSPTLATDYSIYRCLKCKNKALFRIVHIDPYLSRMLFCFYCSHKTILDAILDAIADFIVIDKIIEV